MGEETMVLNNERCIVYVGRYRNGTQDFGGSDLWPPKSVFFGAAANGCRLSLQVFTNKCKQNGIQDGDTCVIIRMQFFTSGIRTFQSKGV